MIPVRQSTTFEFSIGPVLDADGVAFTGAVVGDFQIKKTTSDWAALNGSATATHTAVGNYDLELTSLDLGTVGVAAIRISDTVNACATVYLQVMEEAVYDALYAASANGFAGAAGASTVTFANTSIATVTTATNVTTVNGLAANVITATSIAADAITDAKVASDVTIASVTGSVNSVTTGVTLAAGAVTNASLAGNMEIVFETDFATNYSTSSDRWNAQVVQFNNAAITANAFDVGSITADAFAAGAINAAAIANGAIDAATFAADVDAEARSWLGLASANLDTQISAIDTVVDSILVDTGTTLDTIVDSILVQATIAAQKPEIV